MLKKLGSCGVAELEIYEMFKISKLISLATPQLRNSKTLTLRNSVTKKIYEKIILPTSD
jgi:hypothetical protein